MSFRCAMLSVAFLLSVAAGVPVAQAEQTPAAPGGVMAERCPGLPADIAALLRARDYDKARLPIYRIVERRNDPAAALLYGRMLFAGLAMPENRCLATFWFDAAARGGLRPAMTELAAAYESGWGVRRNPALARQWRERAAGTNRDDPAQQPMAEVLPLPPEIAITPGSPPWLAGLNSCSGPAGSALPPEQGHLPPPAPGTLARLHAAIDAKDYQTAWTIVVPAALAGNAEAQERLAHLWTSGLGAEPNGCAETMWDYYGARGGDPTAKEGFEFYMYLVSFSKLEKFGLRWMCW